MNWKSEKNSCFHWKKSEIPTSDYFTLIYNIFPCVTFHLASDKNLQYKLACLILCQLSLDKKMAEKLIYTPIDQIPNIVANIKKNYETNKTKNYDYRIGQLKALRNMLVKEEKRVRFY